MRVTGSVSGSASGLLNVEGDGDKIEVTQVLTEGTKIATITINEGTEEEETIDLYAPEGFSGSWNDLTDKPTLFSGVYADLSGKPYLNGNVIRGNMYTNIYSTDEQIVGVWINGKPVYQRTFTFDISTVTDWTLFDNSVSYENLIFAYGFISTPTSSYPIVSNFNDEPRWSIQNNILTYYYNGLQRQGNVTILYTKTTDVA